MRAGRLRLIPVAELERWISENAARLGDRRRAHDCRHTFASLMIAAGVNAKALSEFMGHASIKITMDLTGT